MIMDVHAHLPKRTQTLTKKCPLCWCTHCGCSPDRSVYGYVRLWCVLRGVVCTVAACLVCFWLGVNIHCLACGGTC